MKRDTRQQLVRIMTEENNTWYRPLVSPSLALSLPPLAPLDAPTPGRSGVAGGSSPQMLYSCPYDYPPGALPNGFGGWCFTNATACAAGASPSRKQAHAMAAGRAAAAE